MVYALRFKEHVVPTAFASRFPAHFQGRIDSTSRSPGVTCMIERTIHALQAPTSGAHSSTCTLSANRGVRQNDYECKTSPDDLAFRKATNARPRSPVPSKSRDEGSGVAKLVETSTASP